MLRMVVPTATVIPFQQHRGVPSVIAFSSVEHDGKLIFPTGKCKPSRTINRENYAAYEDPYRAALRHLRETAKLRLTNGGLLWAVATDANRDVRNQSLKLASDGLCRKELSDVEVIASYGCPDYIWVAWTTGEPKGDGCTTGKPHLLDPDKELDVDRFAAGHGILFHLLRRWWKNGGFGGGNIPTAEEMANFSSIKI